MRHLALLSIVLSSSAAAQPPPGYYDSAQGLTGEALRAALHDIISPHTVLPNSQLWAAFARTDRKPDGTVWDIYSDVPGGTPPYTYQFVADQCGTYNSEGDCFNREHTFPVSWFGDGAPMNTDLHHIYPADAWVNQQRGNWPFGTVSAPNWTSMNGGKRGPCTWPGCAGTVFEPIDAYKGDIARGHLYMLTRYLDVCGAWPAPVLNAGQWQPWAIGLLLAWHQQDPVSAKETARNDSVFVIQGNRNPFIDQPQWAEQIWGAGAGVADARANPAMQLADGQLWVSDATMTQVEVRDALGRLCASMPVAGEGRWTLRLAAGTYVALAWRGEALAGWLRFTQP